MEDFLINKAVDFDLRNVARTYLLLNQEKICVREIEIAAYFSVAVKPLELQKSLSKGVIKKIDGYSKDVLAVSTILIGQLGKDLHKGKTLSGNDLLNAAMGIVDIVFQTAGCRTALVECQKVDKLISFYERNGFVPLQTNGATELLQMVRFL